MAIIYSSIKLALPFQIPPQRWRSRKSTGLRIAREGAAALHALYASLKTNRNS